MRNKKSIPHEKLSEFLRRMPEEKMPENFDRRFWARFEVEKNRPLPLGWRVPALPLLAGVAVVLAAGFLILPMGERPSLGLIQGKILLSDGRPFSAPQAGKALKSGESLQTDSSSWAIVEVKNGYRVKVHPDSEVRIEQLRSRLGFGKSVFYVSKGEVLVSIGDESGRKYPLEIRTPTLFARAMGTQFLVSVASQASVSEVSVLKGQVRVGLPQQKPVNVNARQEIQVQAQGPLNSPRAMNENTVRDLEELFQFGKKNQVILLMDMSSSRTRQLLRPCGIYIRMDASLPEAGYLQRIVENIRAADREEDRQGHLRAAEELENRLTAKTSLDPIPPLLFVGAYYAYLGEYQQAIRVFENTALFYPKSHYASLAMMASALLYEEKLGQHEKAQAIARSLLKTYPKSYEAIEASRLLKE